MNKYSIILCATIWIGLANLTFAQDGTIRGSVFDGANGKPLTGVNILLKETSKGASTDIEGHFSIDVPAGTYDVRITYISYQSKTIKGVKVGASNITVLDNIRLQEKTEEMEEVVVTAEAVNISEAALLTQKRKSANLLDGISAEKIKKTGASNAADALKKVTGVSIQGGKYVYVRGLGDRYTKTMLNGVEIPSLDPTKNSLQIDIFPTNLIQNMIVNKTATAKLPADFTGGIVNVETIDFPNEPIFDISVSTGYNPQMHFNNQFLTYDGSSTDFLGFDSGARELPNGAAAPNIPTPISGASGDQVYNFVDSFNPTLGPRHSSNVMDYSLGISLGNQKEMHNQNVLGYIFSATYKNSSSHFDDYRFGEYQVPAAADQYELIRATTQNGAVSERNVLLGGLAGLAYKTRRSKYKLTAMHLQNGESRSADLFIDNSQSAPGQSGYLGDSHNLEYSQRSISNMLLNGVHYFNESDWKIDWRLSPTLSKMTDPDIRQTTYTLRGEKPNQNYIFNAGAGGFPSRLWRDMDEMNLVGRANINRDYKLLGGSATLKFGGSHVYKQRDYEILSFNMAFFGNQPEWTGNTEEILEDDNIYGNDSKDGTVYYQSGNVTPNPNAYSSNVHNSSLYLSNEVQPFTDLKLNVGLRAESYVQRHTGRSVRFAQGDKDGKNLKNEKVLDAFDLFPSANLTYFLADGMNLRLSYSKTIARPSFRELSFAQILDPVSDRRFNGGLFPVGCDQEGNSCRWDGNLTETRIQNFDLRLDQYFNRDELMSISAFYKSLDDPIELVRLRNSVTSSEYQPRNVGKGKVYGLELELRKSLGFIAGSLKHLKVNSNVTVVKSVIEMTENEFKARKKYEKEGQAIDHKREMAGQAPYIINGGLTYDDPGHGFDVGLFYNLKGETLTLVGGGIFPDVYSEPFHSLRFNLNKTLGPNDQYALSLSVSNILNDSRQETYRSYQAADQVYSSFKPHRSVSIGLKYSFL